MARFLRSIHRRRIIAAPQEDQHAVVLSRARARRGGVRPARRLQIPCVMKFRGFHKREDAADSIAVPWGRPATPSLRATPDGAHDLPDSARPAEPACCRRAAAPARLRSPAEPVVVLSGYVDRPCLAAARAPSVPASPLLPGQCRVSQHHADLGNTTPVSATHSGLVNRRDLATPYNTRPAVPRSGTSSTAGPDLRWCALRR